MSHVVDVQALDRINAFSAEIYLLNWKEEGVRLEAIAQLDHSKMMMINALFVGLIVVTVLMIYNAKDVLLVLI